VCMWDGGHGGWLTRVTHRGIKRVNSGVEARMRPNVNNASAP